MDGWDAFHRRWAGLTPPLRPDADVVAEIADRIAGHDDAVLLLGMTPELATIGMGMTAVDSSEAAIARIWPGDDAHRHAVCADWRDMPLASGSMSAVIGDGSINMLASADEQAALFAELARVLRPGGRVAVRAYLTPSPCESVADLRGAVIAGGVGFHAFKWRLAMALVAESGEPDIAVTRIHAAFATLFPDRDALARASGWSLDRIAEIDAYRRSPTRFSFPTADRFLAAVPSALFREVQLVPAGGYELAERCPLLTAARR